MSTTMMVLVKAIPIIMVGMTIVVMTTAVTV